MKKTALISVAAMASSFILAGVGFAGARTTTYKLNAQLNSRQVVPQRVANAQSARGTFVATLGRLRGRWHIAWTLTSSHLSSRATNSYIHIGKAGAAGPVVVIVCGPCQPVARGDAYVSRTVVHALVTGAAYVQVNTRKNPKGEIRGQIRRSS